LSAETGLAGTVSPAGSNSRFNDAGEERRRPRKYLEKRREKPLAGIV
jgi:hypothetical protein